MRSQQTASPDLKPCHEDYPEPAKRKLILVLSKKEFDDLDQSTEKAAEDILSDPSMHVISLPLAPALANREELQGLIKSNQLYPGMLLVQNPFSMNEYEVFEQATDNIAHAKHFYFTEMCMYLGARSVRVEDGRKLDHELQAKAAANVAYAAVDSEAKLDSQYSSRLAASLCLEDLYSDSCEPDFENAKSLLEQTKLWWTDRAMQNLYKMRLKGQDRFKSRQLEINLTREVTAAISLSISISASLAKLFPKLPEVASLKLSAEAMSKTRSERCVKFQVVF